MMKIGVRAHDYGRMGIDEMASLLKREGYGAAQIVMPKAFREIEGFHDITPSQLERIRTSFSDKRLEITVLGCYMDLGNPDPDVRKEAVRNLKDCLRYSKILGAKMVGTETAYPHLDQEEKRRWRPYMLDSIQRVVEEAQRLDAVLAVEPVYWHPLDSLEGVLELIRRVDDSRHLRLIFDASNLLEHPDTTDQNREWDRWLNTVGEEIDTMHIKDFTLDETQQYQPVRLGAGVMRYETISRWLLENRPEMPLIREEMNPVHAKEDIAFLRRL